MKRLVLNKLLLTGVILLGASNAFGAPIPPPPTPIGGEFWPYVTTGAVLGVSAWKLWKK